MLDSFLGEKHRADGKRILGNRAPKIIAVLVVVSVAVSLIAGCDVQSEQFLARVENKLKRELGEIPTQRIIIDKATPAGKQKSAQRTFQGRGVPKPVTVVNTGEAVTESFNATTAENNDTVSIDIRYKISQTNQQNDIFKQVRKLAGTGVSLTSLIPKTIDKKQKVLSLEFSVKPSRIYDLGENRYAEFEIKNPRGDYDIHIKAKLKLLRYDLSSAMRNTGAKPLSNNEAKANLKDEKYIEKQDGDINKIARSINGRNEIDTVRQIFEFVLQNMEYDKSKAANKYSKSLGATLALRFKKGVCVEYADLFVALCRAKGIPARYVGGLTTEGTDPTKGHAWAEVYLKNYGWVPFDPTWGDTKAVTFDKLKPLYIYLTNVRNDEVLSYSDIYGFEYWGAPFNVEFSVLFDSSRSKYIKGLQADINSKKAELAQINSQLDAVNSVLNSMKSGVDTLRAEINQLSQAIDQVKSSIESGNSTDMDGYRNLVSRYNGMVASLNGKISSYNQKIEEYKAIHKSYEGKRNEINSLVNSYNSLN